MRRKGTYVLFLRFPNGAETSIGSLGRVSLPAGDYCYVGSAMGGLDQRLSRHLSSNKKIRWHIDRLTLLCQEMHAFEYEGESVPECSLAALMKDIGNVPVIKGFGCSDCHCETHLFRVDPARTEAALTAVGMVPFADRRQ